MFVKKTLSNPNLAWAGTIEYGKGEEAVKCFFTSNLNKKLNEFYFPKGNEAIPEITITGFSFLGIHILKVNTTSLRMAMSI